MRKQYDFSTSRKNPYAVQLKKSVTIRLDEQAITNFKSMSEETGIPYQSLTNLYLKECAASRRVSVLTWLGSSAALLHSRWEGRERRPTALGLGRAFRVFHCNGVPCSAKTQNEAHSDQLWIAF